METADRDAVLAEFDLSDPVAVPATAGLAAIHHDDCTRVYVSPTINGWTLVVGLPGVSAPPRRAGGGVPDEVAESVLARLSRRFGRAYHFRLVDEYEDPDGCNVWRLAEKGETVAEFRPTFTDVATDRWARLGLVDESEFRTWLAADFLHECGSLPRRPDEPVLDWARRLAESEEYQDWSTLPMTIWSGPLSCRAVSVRMAGWFGADDTVDDTGVLALTGYGRRFGHRGLLRLT